MNFFKLLIIVGLFTSLYFYSCAQKDILSKSSLKNLTYENESTNFGSVTLKDGEFSEKAAPGSSSSILVQLSDVITYGEINGKRAAAVILITNSAGSGVFYDLAVVQEQMEKTNKVATINLGDRIKINSVIINNDTVQVDLFTQDVGEPMVKHSKREVRKYLVNEDGSLKEAVKRDENSIIGIEWKFKRIAYANDTEKRIADPQQYLLLLSADKKVNIKADCNMGFGSYILSGSSLKISILGTTRAMCPPDSFSDKYISELGAVVSYVLKGEKLYLSLKIDSGIMEFVK